MMKRDEIMENETKEEIVKEEKHKKNKKEELKVYEEKIKSLEDELLRSKAELINYRKRKDEEVEKYLKYASSDLISSLLLVVDNFERALDIKDESINPDIKNFLSGFKLIYDQFKEILSNNGVMEIPSLNKKFDSRLHNCMFTKSDPNVENDLITEVVTKGYTYHDKILRCASVIVNVNNNDNKEKEDEKNE